ncbi:MAG: hypothetical protein IPK90_10160 [Chitinophagaceae bacterium]|nr:hypothetical protein [Chitinophagaceae bacterium]
MENTTTLTHIVLFLISASLLLWQDSIFSFEYGNAISRIIISLSFVLIIASQAITKSDSRFNLGRLGFANKWGKYTYGIYLLHPIALQ